MGPAALHAHGPQAQPALGSPRRSFCSLPRPRSAPSTHRAPPSAPSLSLLYRSRTPSCLDASSCTVWSPLLRPSRSAARDREASGARSSSPRNSYNSPSSTLRFFAAPSPSPARPAHDADVTASFAPAAEPASSSTLRFLPALAAALGPADVPSASPVLAPPAGAAASAAPFLTPAAGAAAAAAGDAAAGFFLTTRPGSVLRLPFLGALVATLGAAAAGVAEEVEFDAAGGRAEVDAVGRGGESERAAAAGGGAGATRLWTALRASDMQQGQHLLYIGIVVVKRLPACTAEAAVA